MRKEKTIIDIKIYKIDFSSLDIYRNIVIIYILKGNASIDIDGKIYEAKEDDVVVINADESFKVRIIDNSIVGCFIIDRSRFNKLIKNKDCSFMCNSMIENNENYDILRNKLKNILNKLIDTGDYKNIYIYKLYYDMLIFLLNNFCNKIISSENDINSRINSILNYIEDNYNYPLNLRDISKEFFLTPEYFAKYFKESTGKTFLNYLNEIRIKYAIEDLINTKNTILKVSLDNGFPNVASFNKYFKEIYGISPSLYRKENKRKDDIGDTFDVLNILENIDFYEDDNKNIININVDTNNEFKLDEYWKEIIGGGSIELLSDSNVQKQIIDIKEQLGFKYLRIVFDNNKYINDNNIYHIEKIFDFLVCNGFKLFIVFEYRMIEDKNKFLKYIRDIIKSCANRYSIKSVRNWRFELFYDSDFESDRDDRYFEIFKDISEQLKRFDIKTDLMGPGLLLSLDGKNLDNYLKKYKRYDINSSVITFSAMPCTLGKTQNDVFINRLTDRYYIRTQIDLANKIIKENNLYFDEVIISKWVDSLSNNNIINDSCYEGANIVNNILNCYGRISAICYYQSLDILCDKNNSNSVISGLPGLISKDGIKKPSYYSYKFLNNILSKYVYKDEYCIIGVNDIKNYQIVCHNCKKLNYKYFTEDENKLRIEDISEYYDDKDKVTLAFKLSNVKNGEYIIKYRKVNEEFGSVQDNIKKIKIDDIEIGPSEIEYLKDISIPSIKLEEKIVENTELEFIYVLEPNEIAYIHIIYKY